MQPSMRRAGRQGDDASMPLMEVPGVAKDHVLVDDGRVGVRAPLPRAAHAGVDGFLALCKLFQLLTWEGKTGLLRD